MLAIKLETLQKYLYEEQANGQIHPFTSSTDALIIFVKKADSSLCLYVEYCSLNATTKEN